MKTTLDLPPEIMRAVKVRAAESDRKLKDTVADLLKRGLARDAITPRNQQRRVKLPLVRCARRARAGQEITPERAAEILLGEESGRASVR
jgi:plasmid stability protein